MLDFIGRIGIIGFSKCKLNVRIYQGGYMNKKKILVIIDPQVEFINGILGTPEAEKATEKMVELLNNDADEYDATFFHCPFGEEGWFIESRIANRVCKHKNFTILHKENFGYDDWKETIMDIVNIPASSKGEELVIKIIGLVTNMCVIVNALDIQTVFPEAEIIVDAPCCAGTTPEAHKAALMVMESCQIKVNY